MSRKLITKIFNTITGRKITQVDHSDFSIFMPPLTNKKRLQEECKRQDISIYKNDPMEQCSGANAIFRIPMSEAELDRCLSTNKAIILSELANTIANRASNISFIALILSTIALVKSFQ